MIGPSIRFLSHIAMWLFNYGIIRMKVLKKVLNQLRNCGLLCMHWMILLVRICISLMWQIEMLNPQSGTQRILLLFQPGIQGTAASGFPQRRKTPVHHDAGAEGTVLQVLRLCPGVSVPDRAAAVSKQLQTGGKANGGNDGRIT